ncbi:NXPE family member 2-like [Ptychodera flava]|uniref:NXPE family member 2-like n=1 Tax=Ptychodera flava TaxID=63121 RepID=UPI00396A9C93
MPLRLSFMTIRPRLTSLFCVVLGMAIGMFLNSKSGLSVKDGHAFVTYVRDIPTTISRTVTPASFIPTPQIEEEPKQVTGGIKMATAVHDNVAEADDLNFPLDKSQELILFPYNKFSRYGLEWKGIVEELMWADKETDGTTSPGDKPFLIGDGTLGLTSVNSSRIYLKGNRTIFSRGELIHLVIEAEDEQGRARGRGGDFFFAVLSNDIKHQRTAGRVFDHGNGTYDVYFHAAWTGAANITLMLYFTREAVHWLNTQVRGQEDRIGWIGIYTLDPENSEEGEYSFCHIVNEGTWENECEYRNPVSIGKTVFLCERPKNFKCEDMYALVGDVDGLNIRAAQMINESYNMKIFSRDYIKASFAANPIKLEIKEPVDGVPVKNGIPEVPLCDADQPVPISDGFWRDKMVYEYSSCKATQFSDQEIFQCLENRHLWFCGDSTMRQWYICCFSY